MANRDEMLEQWLRQTAPRYGLRAEALAPASSDAGFRRYFRVPSESGRSFIVMDAPPEHENTPQYLKVCALMREAGLNVPEVFEADLDAGFALISDLGNQTYLDVLNEENAAKLMDAATTALVTWQKASRPGVLPEYDRAVLERELELFPEWYVKRHRGVEWDETERKWWAMTKEFILKNNLREAQVFVHRDFMPRNLMVSDPMPGVIDFQDALYGPVSYDIASLLRDAFVSWGESFVLDTTIRYWEKARRAGIPVPEDFGVFYRDVEFMGVQRHLKVLGIFARINYRDGKPKYLADTPRFIDYVRKTSQRYSELSPLMHLIERLEGPTRWATRSDADARHGLLCGCGEPPAPVDEASAEASRRRREAPDGGARSACASPRRDPRSGAEPRARRRRRARRARYG